MNSLYLKMLKDTYTQQDAFTETRACDNIMSLHFPYRKKYAKSNITEIVGSILCVPKVGVSSL
jgi:hypothetical protein